MRNALLLLLPAVLFLGNSSNEHGIWVKTSGEEVTAPCPSAFDEEARMRLPRGCEAPSHGVLITTQRYIDTEKQIAGLKEKIEGLERVSALQKQRIANLELQLTLKVVDCPVCSCEKLKTFTFGAAVGSLATTSACLYLTSIGE